jgi:nitrite reductase (NO-forming)/hydroxylamine reductase
MTGRTRLRAGHAWLLAIGCAAVLAGGAAPAQQAATGAATPQVHQAEVAGAGASPAQIKAGEQVFQTVCMACHQADGKGIAGAFPPLAGSDFLLSNKDRAVGIVVNGLQGEVLVNGAKFNSVMPAMIQLADQEIADALTYALNSWGNSGGSVAASQVSAERARAAQTPKKADSPTQHPTTVSELKYQGAPSPAGAEGAQILVTPGAPAMTLAVFDRAQ